MTIYTMGFTQKSAETFFELIKKNNIEILVDVRLNNQSQLAGFTKGRDLEYFLKQVAGCDYSHNITYAPTKQLLDDYKKGKISWAGYEEVFGKLIKSRDMAGQFIKAYGKYERVLLLCSEPTPEMCHRRLVAEAVAAAGGFRVVHL